MLALDVHIVDRKVAVVDRHELVVGGIADNHCERGVCKHRSCARPFIESGK